MELFFFDYGFRSGEHAFHVGGHLTKKGHPKHGLYVYRLEIRIRRDDELREIRRTIENQPELKTPMEVFAFIIALYPVLNEIHTQPVESPDPLDELRKQIETL